MSAARDDVGEHAEHIATPTLLIWATETTSSRSSWRTRSPPSCREPASLRSLASATIPLEQPERFNTLVAQWVDELAGRESQGYDKVNERSLVVSASSLGGPPDPAGGEAATRLFPPPSARHQAGRRGSGHGPRPRALRMRSTRRRPTRLGVCGSR